MLIKNKIKHKVVFHGLIKDEKKWLIYEKCGALVLPSKSEGQPLVILEALGKGLYIIATNVGSIPDTIDNDNGQLIPPNNKELLVKAINDYLNKSDSELQIFNKRNMELFSEKYSLEAYYIKTKSLFEKFV
jgi:glycosyltransferase involved in cell wall biosynthesis